MERVSECLSLMLHVLKVDNKGLRFLTDTRAVRKVKNVCAYHPCSCSIVPDQLFGAFSIV